MKIPEATIVVTFDAIALIEVTEIINDLVNNPSTAARKRGREFLEKMESVSKPVKDFVGEHGTREIPCENEC